MFLETRARSVFAAAAALLVLTGSAGRSFGHERVGFNREVRPILSENCFFCHGPDKNRRKADLRLDVRDQALEHGAIVPGKPDESELVARISSSDPDQVMPPPGSHKSLTPDQKAVLRQWIADGAEYEGHWAYLPPIRPAAPAGPDGIDHLVRERLKKLGLQPSPEADRRTLARRLSSDLIGLPPNPDDVDAFLDDTAPDAYAKLVEKLLASPHYGERMATGWLDLVRFADTIGYHSDNSRNVWPYRDYVIHAFNQNKPFDRFTIEQLAGDLLPGSTQEQRVASCFNRLLLTTEEGGAQAKDYEARMLGDRVRAVGAVWLGQTLGCCQCHDHKFDPASTRDFYSMGAFFADIKEPIIGAREPGMLLPNEEQAKQLAGLEGTVTRWQGEWDAASPPLRAAEEAWEKAVLAELADAARWVVLHPEEPASDAGVRLAADKDGTVSANENPRDGTDTYHLSARTNLKGITGIRLDVLTHPSLPAQGPGRAGNGNFVLTEFRVADGANQPVAVAHASATFEQSGFPAAATVDDKLEPGNGWAVDGAIGANAICFEFASPIGSAEDTVLRFTLSQQHGSNHVLGRFRLSATSAPKPVRAPAAALPPQEIRDIIQLEPARRDDAQKAKLTAYFKNTTPALFELRARLAQAKQALNDFEAPLPRSLVSVALERPRTVRILPRGNWQDETGPVVEPAVPHYLPPAIEGRQLTRLDLAQWIVARDNPLTARVFVNRLWKQLFGTGLSKTLDDLGSQGEWPAQPELVDWLAREFMDSGWDVKHMVRLIVSSRTYRQASTASPELAARDPYNRELARQSRFRIDAELVRDNALALSGLLVPKIGGPSVKPYQPDGYWENLNFPPRTYAADRGEDQYRRGIYTWWQRTFPNPSLLAFDAPTREECLAERSRSNIPQQALVLLNDPTYVEAARGFATRILREGDGDAGARITWAWRQALARPPRDDEKQTVERLLDKHRAAYAQEPKAAGELLRVGLSPPPSDIPETELAAWTNVARVILNLHEVITRD